MFVEAGASAIFFPENFLYKTQEASTGVVGQPRARGAPTGELLPLHPTTSRGAQEGGGQK